MKKIFTLLTLLLMAMSINASKVVTRIFQVTLADGRTVTAQTRGDENCHYVISDTNELLVFENGVWRVATQAECKKTFANLPSSSDSQVSLAKSTLTATSPFPHIGTPKVLVIMVNFTDATFTYSKDDINQLLNGTTYDTTTGLHGYSSAGQFFNDCSGGKFRPQFDIVGPYTLNHNTKYYGDENDDMSLFIPDACAAAESAGVDFSQYDSDNDGRVDLVYVLYAGYGENWDNGKNKYLLYPKSGYASDFGTFGGKQVFRYAIDAELVGYPGIEKEQGLDKSYLNGIGVFVHEMTHTMGLPDFYPTTKWDDVTYYDNQSMEEWDLMDGGENIYNGYYPAPYSAWERELFGWDTIDTLSTCSDITLKSYFAGGKALRVMNDNDETQNEYYILETIPSGANYGWYRKMPGEGLVVTHINYSKNYFSNFSCPNNVHGSPRITLLPADECMYSSYRCQKDPTSEYYLSDDDYKKDLKGDPYPGLTNTYSLTDWKPYTGTIDKPITDIVYSEGVTTFKFMGGTPTAINEIQNEESDKIYSIEGLNRGTDSSVLPHGIYIKNGKKFIK